MVFLTCELTATNKIAATGLKEKEIKPINTVAAMVVGIIDDR